jgi:hypothetical protein
LVTLYDEISLPNKTLKYIYENKNVINGDLSCKKDYVQTVHKDGEENKKRT